MRIRCLFVVLVLGCPAWSQSGAASVRAVPRLPDGKPDFSGIWIGGGPVADLEAGLRHGESVPILPSAKKLMSERLAQEDPETNCLPTGIPRQAPYPWTFAMASRAFVHSV